MRKWIANFLISYFFSLNFYWGFNTNLDRGGKYMTFFQSMENIFSKMDFNSVSVWGLIAYRFDPSR